MNDRATIQRRTVAGLQQVGRHANEKWTPFLLRKQQVKNETIFAHQFGTHTPKVVKSQGFLQERHSNEKFKLKFAIAQKSRLNTKGCLRFEDLFHGLYRFSFPETFRKGICLENLRAASDTEDRTTSISPFSFFSVVLRILETSFNKFCAELWTPFEDSPIWTRLIVSGRPYLTRHR